MLTVYIFSTRCNHKKVEESAVEVASGPPPGGDKTPRASIPIPGISIVARKYLGVLLIASNVESERVYFP